MEAPDRIAFMTALDESLTQRGRGAVSKLADAIGISQPAVSKLRTPDPQTGRPRRGAKYDTMSAVAKFFGYDLHSFLQYGHKLLKGDSNSVEYTASLPSQTRHFLEAALEVYMKNNSDAELLVLPFGNIVFIGDKTKTWPEEGKLYIVRSDDEFVLGRAWKGDDWTYSSENGKPLGDCEVAAMVVFRLERV